MGVKLLFPPQLNRINVIIFLSTPRNYKSSFSTLIENERIILTSTNILDIGRLSTLYSR